MTVPMEIVAGSILLLVCLFIHIMILLTAISTLRRMQTRVQTWSKFRRWIMVFGVAIGAVIGANTIEVWVFAVSILAFGALPSLADSIYFALVTYTTLGYGDVVLDPGFRIYGAFGSVTGLLAFGLSTAFLVNLFTRLVPPDLH